MWVLLLHCQTYSIQDVILVTTKYMKFVDFQIFADINQNFCRNKLFELNPRKHIYLESKLKAEDHKLICNDVLQPICIDYIYLPLIVKEIHNSTIYRRCLIRNFRNVSRLKDNSTNVISLYVEYKKLPPIDYKWGDRCNYILKEREYLDSGMSWLSTLGGAYSALGDYDSKFAECAGITSFRQMKVAQRLQDDNIKAKCWLFYSLSLMQKKKFQISKIIIQFVFQWQCKGPKDSEKWKIRNMCFGIWTKLKHDRSLHLNRINLI